MLIVETGSCLPDAESYVSVTDADAYHAARGNVVWAGDDTTKEAMLRKAASYMDGFYRTRYIGRKRSPDQALCWPRINAVDVDGWLYPLDVVPRAISQACCEAALRALTGDLQPDVVNSGIITYYRDKTGPLEEETHYQGGSVRTRYMALEDILSGVVRGRGIVELVRS